MNTINELDVGSTHTVTVRRRRLAGFWLLGLLLVLIAPFGQVAYGAEPYPSRPVQLIVPFPAGGPTDVVARLYAKHLSTILGQPVIVMNRDGAGGIIGTDTAARAAPDGYTLVFGTASTMVINEVTIKKIPYDFFRDFSLIGLVARAPHILAVREGFPAKTAEELITLVRKNPGKYTFASSGTGTIIQMAGELFKLETGLDILHVPYKGGGPASLALLAGEVDMTFNDLTTLKTSLLSGKLRPLAVSNDHRLKLLPDTPTFAELGRPKIVSSSWWGVAVPAKTPAEIQVKLKAANSKIVVDPAYVAFLAQLAIENLVLSPIESNAFIQSEQKKWKAVANAANIHLD
jgi:tripartite-type tricarboxylate transporter receptor subunit TctC